MGLLESKDYYTVQIRIHLWFSQSLVVLEYTKTVKIKHGINISYLTVMTISSRKKNYFSNRAHNFQVFHQ